MKRGAASKKGEAPQTAENGATSPSATASFKSPLAKRVLFESPQRTSYSSSPSRSPKSPSQRKNIIGYLIATGEPQIAKTQNVFFEIKVQVATNTFEYVRLMTTGLTARDKSFFKDNIGKIIKLEGVSVTDNQMQFYNECTGGRKSIVERTLSFPLLSNFYEIPQITGELKTTINVKGHIFWIGEERSIPGKSMLRDGMLVNSTGQIGITIWGTSLYSSIEEGCAYEVHNLATRVFYALKLNTTKNSIVMKLPGEKMARPQFDAVPEGVQAEDRSLTGKILTADFVNISSSRECIICTHVFVTEPNDDFPRCPECKKRQPFEEMQEKRTAKIDVLIEGKQRELEMEIDVAETFFKLEKSHTEDHLDNLEHMFLKLKNAKFCIKNNKITSLASVDTQPE